MLDVHDRYGRVGARAAGGRRREEISSYGCVEPEDGRRRPACACASIVEKPPPEDAPSNLAVIGRYVFTPEIFDALDRIEPGRRRRAPAHRRDRAAARGPERCTAACSRDGRYDIGQKLDFLRANIELALDRDDLGPELGRLTSRAACVDASRRDRVT